MINFKRVINTCTAFNSNTAIYVNDSLYVFTMSGTNLIKAIFNSLKTNDINVIIEDKPFDGASELQLLHEGGMDYIFMDVDTKRTVTYCIALFDTITKLLPIAGDSIYYKAIDNKI